MVNPHVQRNSPHEVTATQMPDDRRRICPLLGNDEIKYCVDARGVMHDFAHIWGSHPPPRITWSGRRHDRRDDRYNSNLFEWGYLDLQFAGEGQLPAVTHWRQRLHVREGYVETEIQRGEVIERTISFVHLQKNLLVFHRQYENLPASADRRLHACYRLCQVGTETLPFRLNWSVHEPFANGISADTVADGMRLYRGRIALFADAAATASSHDNALLLDLELPADNGVTVCLSMNDDLGNHPQILAIEHDGWMTPAVREVHRENRERLQNWVPGDYAAVTDTLLAAFRDQGFAGIFADHRQAWHDYFAQLHVELPPEEPALRAVLDTQLYTMRCCYTAWSSPANPFNTSWGAPYFWDERFPTEGLMRLGIMDMPERTIEWRRTILPFSTMMSGGRGARYVPAAVESGSQIADRNCTQYYEFFTIGVLVNYLYEYCRYKNDEAVWRRYYPVLRESAEFFRRYLLIELPGNNIMLTWLVDVNESIYPVQDGPFAACGAARIFEVVCKVAERLAVDEEMLGEWRRVGAMTMDLARHLCGGSKLERDSELNTADNPASVFIDYELGDASAPELPVDPAIRAWRDQYRKRFEPESQMCKGKTNVSGETEHMPFWSWGPLQVAHSAATCGEADKALDNLRLALKTLMDFSALNESAQTDLSDVHHPWFNTAAGAYVRALTRMLVYPRDSEIHLLPGIPAAWKDLAFTLPVHQRANLSLRLVAGHLRSLRLEQEGDSPVVRTIHLPNRFIPDNPVFAEAVTLVERCTDKTVLQVAVTGTLDLLAHVR